MYKNIFAAIGLLVSMVSCTKPTAVIAVIPSGPVIQVTDTIVLPDTVPSRRLHTYLALGDSYTIGQSVPQSDRFPMQAVAKLNAPDTLFEAPEIIAQTGWTTGNLLSALTYTPPSKFSYDIVTLLIGVNNQYQGRSQQEYREQFTVLLEKAIQLAGSNKRRVIVLSIPDYSVTPFAAGGNTVQIANDVDAFNAINRSITLQHEVTYLDITGYSRQAATDRTLLASDGLHPSGKLYRLWTNELVPAIRAALQ